MYRRVFMVLLGGVLAVSVTAALSGQAKEKKLMPGIYAHFQTTEGNFSLKLFERQAPKTVANFMGLAEGTIEPITGKSGKSKPYYDGLTFHRIMDGFMIQGGDPTGTGTGGPGYRFADEIDPKLRFTKAGILAMANVGPNTNGSQFFITLAPTDWLNGKHTIFGEIIEGMDVVSKIGKVKTGQNNKPLTPVIMKKVTIERVPETK
ncbi:MAG: peptidylprolyl isomerase [Acidobacteria bacterium]|nr:peptidylprolyl isomerase [Acidobacteriota bacterium]